MQNFIAIDFETANENADSVCSVGLVVYENGSEIARYYTLINPNQDFNRHNILIHSILPSDVEESPTFKTAWSEIYPKLPPYPFVAHNATFDEKCLALSCKRYGIAQPKNVFYCTYNITRKLVKGLPSYSLDNVAKACGFDLTDHHNALADAEAAAIIALKVL